MKRLLLVLLLALAASSAWAGLARPLAHDEAAEQRMLAITRNLRCLVCQDESLAASQAGLARDLRGEVLKLVERGYTDQQVVDYLVARYGNYVRFRPPFDAETWALWLGPYVLLAFGLGVLALTIRSRLRRRDTPLDAAELARAQALLSRNGELE